MAHDVVVVVIQYRLGALGMIIHLFFSIKCVTMVTIYVHFIAAGYLTLDTEEIPGNAGMADQVEALRWIQKFIKYFGGNKDNVTVVGESAGAASVGFLLLCPQAREERKYTTETRHNT
jgi:carboxylesterase type B